MYKPNKYKQTDIEVNNSSNGETIEQKVERIVTLKEPIKDGAQKIYTERRDGVQPAYNIRTDRFEVAVEAMDKVTRSNYAKRENKADMKIVKEENDGVEPIQGTDGNT